MSYQWPLALGGLGIVDLKLRCQVLQAYWLWLEHTQSEIPWVAIRAKTDAAIAAFFRASTHWLLGDGELITFWSSPWLDGRSIEELAPHLVAAVSRGPHRSCLITSAFEGQRWIRDITGTLSIPVLIQYL
jgi:hypothetical protein